MSGGSPSSPVPTTDSSSDSSAHSTPSRSRPWRTQPPESADTSPESADGRPQLKKKDASQESCRPNAVEPQDLTGDLAEALMSACREAVLLQREEVAAAERAGVPCDTMRAVALPAGVRREMLTADSLGAVGEKLGMHGVRLDYYRNVGEAGELLVRECASGEDHARGAGYVFARIENAVNPHWYHAGAAGDGTYGNAVVTAPDATVASIGAIGNCPPYGRPGYKGHGDRVLYAAEVEHGNRTLPGLIRHHGVVWRNFPNLNGMLGIKMQVYTPRASGGADEVTFRYATLIAVRMDGNPRRPTVTALIDFGPDPLTAERCDNLSEALRLPTPPEGVPAVAGQHGLGTLQGEAELDALWQRVPRGRHADGTDYEHRIPAEQLLSGAVNRHGVAVVVPPAGQGEAVVNLRCMCEIFYGEL